MVTVAELDIAPRSRGRAPKALEIEHVRDLAAADLSLLASERGVKPQPLAKIRDRHHSLARCLASGMTNTEAGAVTGFCPSRISILLGDPTFKQLVADYAKIEDGLLADFTARATTLSLTVLENLQEKAEIGELSTGEEIEIMKSTADRTGHAPVQKSVNVNVNADLGTRLANARRRLESAKQETLTVVSGDTDGASRDS